MDKKTFYNLYQKFKNATITPNEEEKLIHYIKKKSEKENKLKILKTILFVLGVLIGMVLVSLKK